MQPITVTVGPLAAASANNIALSQTPAGAGALTLNGSLVTGGVAILDTPRQVLITTHADESAKTFTITGTDWGNSVISEKMTGPNNTTGASVLSYKTVTSIVVSAALSGAVTVGTNGVASSPWVRFDGFAGSPIAKQCTVVGTANYTVQQTMDDPNSPFSPVNPNAVTWVNDPDVQFVAATANAQGYWSFVPLWARLVLNSSGAGTGTVTMTVQQAGDATY